MRLADSSWDNTGLLVEAPAATSKSENLKILLTIDLTQNVADEAIAKKSDMILAYHPFIFRGLKSITTQDPQQRSLIKLIQNNISVYSPHTAVDSAKGGVNDFLSEGIANGRKNTTSVIEPDAQEEGCGMGRLVELDEPAQLSDLVENAKKSLGLSHVQVGVGRNLKRDHPVKTIAICAGSGGSVFRGVKADLYYTGELSHHEALYFTESGSSIIACNHSNTERAFLSVLKQQLAKELPDDVIEISETDKDPYEVW